MTKFISFVSGKGGVGKTTTTLNVGHALSTLGQKTIIMDANLTTPNLSFHLGLVNPEHTLNQFLRKEKELRDIILYHDSGIKLIPASPSLAEIEAIDPESITEAFEHLDNMAEFVLVDSPSGLGMDVKNVLKNTDESIVVVNPTLSSIMDALKIIQLAKDHNNIIGGIVVNLSYKGRSEMKADEIESILGHPIIGHIYADRKVRKSLHKKAPVHYLYPRSRSAKQFRQVAEHLSLDLLRHHGQD